MRTIIATVCLLAIVAPAARAKLCSLKDPSSCPEGSQCRWMNIHLHPQCVPNSLLGLGHESKRDAQPTINPVCVGRPHCLMLCPIFMEFARDQDGCELCKCVPKTDQDVGKRSQLSFPSDSKRSKICREIPLCKMYCPGGYKKDKDGCALCACKIDISVLQHVTKDERIEQPAADVVKRGKIYHLCRKTSICAKVCPGGLYVHTHDKFGCQTELGCTCIKPSTTAEPQVTAQNPFDVVNKRSAEPFRTPKPNPCIHCDIYCPYGQKLGRDGCPLCECIEPSDLPYWQEDTSEGGSEIVPAEVGSQDESKRGTGYCGDVPLCKMYCPNGYKKDKNGCAKCACKTSSSKVVKSTKNPETAVVG